MTKGASLTPRELREASDEDELVTSSICRRQINPSVPSFTEDLRSWAGPVQRHVLTDFPKCINFIVSHGCTKDRSLIWVQRTFDSISLTATPKQLFHLLHGYADLHELVLYLIPFTDSMPVDERDISTYGGTSSIVKQQKHHRNIAFIMYDYEKFLFAPLYATHKDGRLQTCFASGNKVLIDHIATILREVNLENSSSSASESNPENDTINFATNTKESQKIDDLDVLLTTELTIQHDPFLTKPTRCEADHQHASQVNTQSDLNHNEQKIIINPKDSLANDRDLMSTNDKLEKVDRNLNSITDLLDKARSLLHQEFDDIPSMETDDRQLVTNAVMKERVLISQNGMINMVRNDSRYGKNHVGFSSNNLSQTVVCLSRGATQPTTIEIPNGQSASGPLREYDAPKILREPRRHRRVRMLTDLAKNECPLVQAGEEKAQRAYIKIEVPVDNDDILYARVRVITENGHSHPFKTVAPLDANVDWTLMNNSNERNCLQCDKNSFDPTTECVFLTITPDERKNRRKIVKVYLFNWKQNGPTIKEVIEHENLRLCRLEFHLCIRLSPGEYELVSQASHTSVIEEVDGDVTIDSTKVEPKQLCERGGEKISVPLSNKCRKKDFRVEFNGHTLNNKKFTMEHKKLSITSPPRETDAINLHLTITRTEYVENSSVHTENQLYDDDLPYVEHDSYAHICSQPALNEASIQTS